VGNTAGDISAPHTSTIPSLIRFAPFLPQKIGISPVKDNASGLTVHSGGCSSAI